jgi:hypothetical protein
MRPRPPPGVGQVSATERDIGQFLADLPPVARESVEQAILRGKATRLRFMLQSELKNCDRFVPLLPAGVRRGEPCMPGVEYDLCPQGRAALLFTEGQSFLKLMTHPEDGRAGWHMVAGSLRLEVDAVSPVEHEVPFSAFHWALSKLRTGWEDGMFLEPVEMLARAVLRASEPQPMRHGLWVKLHDDRCRTPRAHKLERELYDVELEIARKLNRRRTS